jgi:hypothetical protein
MDKVIRNGKVAVLYSPGWGVGWFSWHGIEDLLYDPVVVGMVESKESEDTIIEYCHGKYDPDGYFRGAEDLTIKWIDVGTEFVIREYDGAESIEYKEHCPWHVA